MEGCGRIQDRYNKFWCRSGSGGGSRNFVYIITNFLEESSWILMRNQENLGNYFLLVCGSLSSSECHSSS